MSAAEPTLAGSDLRAEVARLRHEVARLRLLAEATNAIAGSHLDLPAILDIVASRVAHVIGDACVIRLSSADHGWLVPVAAHHRDPHADAALRDLVGTVPYRTDDGLQGQVYATGQPAHLDRAHLANLPAAQREHYLRWFATRDAASLLIVPLALSGHVFGTLALVRDAESEPYTAEDGALALDLAARAAIAVHDAQTHAEALRLAAYVRALLDGAADAILVSDETGHYIDANRAAEELYGYPHAELLAMRVGDLSAAGAETLPRFADETAGDVAPVAWRGEGTIRRKDGALVPVEGRVSSVRLPEGEVVYVGSARDISARQRLEHQQREFVRMVSHDLRTPLTTIRGLAQLLQRRVGRDTAYDRERLGQIMAQADRMERLLTDLLDAEQVEAGAIRLNPEPVDLAVLASEVVERAALLGERAFRLDVPAEPLVGVWDRDRLEQILENLLSNAVKYTPEGGEISVGVAVAEDGAGEAALLTVADRGQGIPAEALPHLFERFYRVEREGLAATDGVGLGLSITKALVEAMGGGIDVTSEAGHGSTFTIRLPLAGADSGAVVARGA